MKKAFLLALFLAIPAVGGAQQYPNGPNIGTLANRPATCVAINPVQPNQPQWFFATDNSTLYICVSANTWQAAGSGAAGSVTSFSSGNLSPLFTTTVATSTTTPALSFGLSNAGADTIFGNCTGSTGAPSFTAVASCAPSSLPNGTASFYLSQNCGTATNCQTVSDDTRYVADAVTNGTTTVTSATAAFTSADVGKIAFVMKSNTLECAQTTVASVTNATTILLTSGCSGTSTAAILILGHDDTTNIQTGINSWYTAGGGAFFLPSGMMLVQACFGHSGSTPINGAYFAGPFTGSTAFSGPVFIPTPLFDTTTAFFTGGQKSCFFGGTATAGTVQTVGNGFSNFIIWGAGQNSANSVTNPNIALLNLSQAIVEHVLIFAWLGNATSMTGFLDNYANTIIDSSVQTGCPGVSVTSNGNHIFGGYFQSTTNNCWGIEVQSAGVLDSHGTFTINGETVSGGVWSAFGDTLGGAAQSAILSAGTTRLIGVNATSTTVGSLGTVRVTGGLTTIANSNIANTGGANAYALSQSGGVLGDRGGNTFSGTTGVYTSSGGQVIGAGSATGTLNSSGAIALSGNWGTGASVGTFTGMNSPTQFTITNGTVSTGPSPTVTYTFPTPYLVAPLWCNASDVAGTNTLGTFASSSLTATSVVFTYSLTPTINDTEIVQVTCYVQE